jgi:hypothetical protein
MKHTTGFFRAVLKLLVDAPLRHFALRKPMQLADSKIGFLIRLNLDYATLMIFLDQ